MIVRLKHITKKNRKNQGLGQSNPQTEQNGRKRQMTSLKG
jgi:hypothetical protein